MCKLKINIYTHVGQPNPWKKFRELSPVWVLSQYSPKCVNSNVRLLLNTGYEVNVIDLIEFLKNLLRINAILFKNATKPIIGLSVKINCV